MDLCLVQIDSDILRIINRPKPRRVERIVQREVMRVVQRRVIRIVQRMRSRYRGLPLVLGTVEYPIRTRFMDLGIHVEFLPHEFKPETEANLYGQALESAQDLAAKVGGGPDLLFKGVNLFEILVDQLKTQFLTILRIEHFVRCRTAEPGVLVLLTGLRLAPTSELPVMELIQIGNRKVITYVRSIAKVLSKVLFRSNLTRRASDTNMSAPINFPDTSIHRKRILFVAADNGSTNWAEPLVFVLEKVKNHEDIVPFVVVDDSFTARYLKERLFQCTKHTQSASREAEFHWSKSEPVFRRRTLELIQAHGGTTKGLMISTFMQRYLDKRLLSGVYSLILWIDRVIDGFRPDGAVIFALISNVGMVASRIARIHHVPTLSWVGTWPHGTRPHPEFKLYDATDFVAGYGEEFNRTLAASGLNPHKIIPVGNPKFDAIPRRSAMKDRNYVCARCGAKSGRIFLVATYLLTPGSTQWIRALARQLKKLQPGTFKLVIKPHPDDISDEYRRIVEEEQFSGASIITDVPLYALLNASDIVFTSSSTVGSEAILFNKPLICINLTNTQYAVRYDDEGVALLVEREEEILTAIDKVLHDKKVIRELQTARKRVQRLYAFGLDGRSSDRFVNAIKKVTA